jgi:hypothetical protein
VDAALECDGLDLFKRCGVDHVNAATRIGLDLRKFRIVVVRQRDRDIDPSPIGSDIDKVGIPAQSNSLGHLERLPVDDGERFVRLLADVDSAAVGSDRHAVGRFDPLDLSHYFVCAGIDDVNVVSGRVRLDDPELRLLRRRE